MKKFLGILRACLYGRPSLVERKRSRLLYRLKFLSMQDELYRSFAVLRHSLKGEHK